MILVERIEERGRYFLLCEIKSRWVFLRKILRAQIMMAFISVQSEFNVETVGVKKGQMIWGEKEKVLQKTNMQMDSWEQMTFIYLEFNQCYYWLSSVTLLQCGKFSRRLKHIKSSKANSRFFSNSASKPVICRQIRLGKGTIIITKTPSSHPWKIKGETPTTQVL